MLRKNVDTSNIDNSDEEIAGELERDLERMDHLTHSEIPEGATEYSVTVIPSICTYGPGLHRFGFEIQYLCKGQPVGAIVRTQTEALPMI